MKCRKCGEEVYESKSLGKWLAAKDGWPTCDELNSEHEPDE